MERSISSMLRNWDRRDLANLTALLGLKGDRTFEEIESRFKWLYYSWMRAGAESAARRLWGRLTGKSGNGAVEDLRPTPSYEELLREGCKHLDALEGDATEEELELFLSQAVIIAALQQMKPRERLRFFSQNIDLSEVTRGTGIRGADLRGPMTTFAALGAAQASGIGIYLASTTALGFLTHAVGVTLPFAIYTGLTSTIALVIGPLGWLSAGLWGAWQLTGPEWKRIVPGLVYIITKESWDRLSKNS